MKKNWKGLMMATLLAGALVAGCSSSTPPAADADKGGKNLIGVAIYKFDDTFMSGVRSAISKAAEGKAQLEIVDSQNSQPTQNDKVDLFINKKAKALAINPVDRNAAGVIIDKAKAANIPVVFLNREPLPEDMKKWDKVYYVGAKAEQSGIMEGQLVVDYFKAHPTKDGVIRYVMLKGEPGHQDAEMRTKFAIKAIEDAGLKVEKVAEDTAMWDRVKGQEKMAAFLAAHGDKIDVVLANNDDMALGAIEALKAKGYFKDGKFMPVVGVDATAPALKALEEGTLYGTVLNDANNQGKATFNLTDVLAQGQTPSKENTGYTITDGKYVWIDYKKITKENMNEAK
ncbi:MULTISPECIES: galactose ABC transporter substrate-binding protein [Pelosinus]|uniref:D-galactose/methyl-galactoside binding periplasmic protein MglB n=1 Tax=Pelosinus fermentans B4 TaxID=1149862 RepID=I9AW26_9FIRM|nr:MULTISPECIES: galactose ABC transporter substrate-binding protein [Pelosinus]EIW17112.1 D-galactose ABC transporter substrate binding protein precursor [Pelosinus fermentans B4]EIW23089.1 D-galactose ABC transporter substrate binding protein precursor [Pelosinus fermentans A11]OAM93869.1 Periplasmic binding protein domain containing protein [Pelosinus fermentans DSM 17108]SDQ92913.1 methyl-galactoside transport system substrate-binding protein [Pelosinus fermentans]